MTAEYSFIEDLCDLLTPSQVVKFLQKAVPDLQLRKSSLQLALEKQQWEIAAKQAHSFKSSISLFSVNKLAASLEFIESKNLEVIKTPEFKVSFMTQCQQLIDDLEGYLTKNLI